MARIIDRDLGFRALFVRLRVFQNMSLTVGIHEDDGSETHEEGAGEELTTLQVAAFHEFGTDRIPQRSWLVAGIAENEDRIAALMKRLARSVIANRSRLDPRRALDLLGLEITQLIQARIRAGIAPPLADVTIARKGSSTPLIDTGQLIQSIRHRITG